VSTIKKKKSLVNVDIIGFVLFFCFVSLFYLQKEARGLFFWPALRAKKNAQNIAQRKIIKKLLDSKKKEGAAKS